MVNLEPKKMMGQMSEGMLFDIGYADKVVCAGDPEGQCRTAPRQDNVTKRELAIFL